MALIEADDGPLLDQLLAPLKLMTQLQVKLGLCASLCPWLVVWTGIRAQHHSNAKFTAQAELASQ